MDLTQIPLFGALMKRMAWLNERQTVLAENVANADTPGYVARDLREPDFRSLLANASQQVHLAATQPAHMAPRQENGGFAVMTTGKERGLDGNGVAVEDQMMKVSQTASDYALMTTLYRANLGLFKTVLGGGGSSG